MGFDFLVAVPAEVKNRCDCVSQTAQQMRSPPKVCEEKSRQCGGGKAGVSSPFLVAEK
jgi:hypothetical protein